MTAGHCDFRSYQLPAGGFRLLPDQHAWSDRHRAFANLRCSAAVFCIRGWFTLLLAPAMLCSWPAQAATVQFNGLPDAYAGSMRMAGDMERKQAVGSGSMTTSWWGFKGTEKLGAGLKAGFAYAMFMCGEVSFETAGNSLILGLRQGY